MSMQRVAASKAYRRLALASALGLLVVPLAGHAQQTPPAAARFQQTMQQRQISDQLQKSQQQAQQQRNVSDVAGKALTQGSAAQQALQQADRAQQSDAAARQQDAVRRYDAAAAQGH